MRNIYVLVIRTCLLGRDQTWHKWAQAKRPCIAHQNESPGWRLHSGLQQCSQSLACLHQDGNSSSNPCIVSGKRSYVIGSDQSSWPSLTQYWGISSHMMLQWHRPGSSSSPEELGLHLALRAPWGLNVCVCNYPEGNCGCLVTREGKQSRASPNMLNTVIGLLTNWVVAGAVVVVIGSMRKGPQSKYLWDT